MDDQQYAYLSNSIEYSIGFFAKYVSKCDITQYFDISISEDIKSDAENLNRSKMINLDDFDGVTIIPFEKNEKIHVLISSNTDCPIETTLHELVHVYDFMLFGKNFCNSELYQIRKHHSFKYFSFWSEFHAKTIEIPCAYFMQDILNKTPENQILLSLKTDIKEKNYEHYNQKLLENTQANIRDLMYYLGELHNCNTYDNENNYPIPQEIKNRYGAEQVEELNDILSTCSTFEEFLHHNQILYDYFEKISSDSL